MASIKEELLSMAENNFTSTVEALFKGMDAFVATKTVVGDAVKVDDAIILPLVDVTCGMAAGSFAENAKQRGAGGMHAKMSPSAVLIIQNGVTKLVNIKQQDAVTKILDMVPDFVNKFTGGSKEVSSDALKVAEEMAAAQEKENEES
jgi:uncharacterized spore protein YtfJ